MCLLIHFCPTAEVVYIAYFLHKQINFKLNVFKHCIQLDRYLGHNLRKFILFSMAKLEKVAEK